MTTYVKEFEDSCAAQFASDTKVGILCSVSPEGYPHMALITTISVRSKTSLMWGQFSSGLSKDYLTTNPKCGFLVVSLDQHWWTGKCLHSGTAIKGEDFDFFNNKPTYRYNAYAGIGVVHYHDLVDVSLGQSFPALKIALGFCASNLIKGIAGPWDGVEKLPPFGMDLATKVTTVKFVAYVDTDGFPRIIPALQGFAPDSGRLVFSATPYGDLLERIPADARAAVYMINLDCQNLLLQGRWRGVKRSGLFKGSAFDIERVYNGNLPMSHYVYPPEPLPNVYGLAS